MYLNLSKSIQSTAAESFEACFQRTLSVFVNFLNKLMIKPMGATSCADHYPTVYIYCTEVHLSLHNFYMVLFFVFTLSCPNGNFSHGKFGSLSARNASCNRVALPNPN